MGKIVKFLLIYSACVLIGGCTQIASKNTQEGNSINPGAIENAGEPIVTATSISTPIGFQESSEQNAVETISPELNPTVTQGIKSLPSTGDFSGYDTSNQKCGGEIVSDGVWNYLSAPMPNSNSYCLCKMKIDGTGFKVLDEGPASSISIVGDWIYYVKYDDDYKSLGIFRVNKDGTQKEKIYSGNCRYLIAIHDELYIVDGDDNYSIYSIRNDGSNRRFIAKDGAPIQYENGYLYYSSHPDIYRMNLENPSDNQKVAENVQYYLVYKDNIYYFKWHDNGNLYKKGVYDINSKVINENIDLYFLISNSKIYFTSQERGLIYTMDLDGNNITSLPKDKYGDISGLYGIVDGFVYYKLDAFEASVDKLSRMNSDGSINELIP